MNVDSFRDMYIAERQETRSVEGQPIKALPRMADVGAPEPKQGIAAFLSRGQGLEQQELLRLIGTLVEEHPVHA